MDTQLVEKIANEVKSQGVFDDFRKDSISDVDTKPAYQNLRQRVENNVKKFLSEQKWTETTNKNQLREKLRRHIAESGFLDLGVERIVDQVVNPKIGSVFQPRIEEIAYKFLGLPAKKYQPPPPPLMHPLPPPLPLNAPPPPLNVETCSLLPNDLEQVSPDSDKATLKSEIDGDDKTEVDMDTEDKMLEDEEESPPFEPLVKEELCIKVKNEVTTIQREYYESALDATLKREQFNSIATIKTEIKECSESPGSNNYTSVNIEKDVSLSQSMMDCKNSQDSQLSSVSSDTRLSPAIKDDSILRSSQEEAVTANISEEAQMPKFNENSSETNGVFSKNEVEAELHFDIKKDEIKFEGTDRKNKVEDSQESPLVDEVKSSLSSELVAGDYKKDSFKFSSNNNSNMEQREDDLQSTPNAQELSFGSSIDDSTSIPPNTPSQLNADDKDKDLSMEGKSPSQFSTPKQQQPSTPIATPTPPTPLSQTTPSPASVHKTEKEYHTPRHSSSSSSAKHKKHSKERRRSQDREKDKDRYHSSRDSKHSKHHSSSSSSVNKNRSSKYSSSSTSKYSSHHKSTNEKDVEKSSSSHSSSKHGKYSSSSDRRHQSSSSHRDQSSSSSSTTSSKRSERKDDHQEAKHKPQRRKSTDSNDDDNDKNLNGLGGKSSSQHNKSNSTSSSKSKSKSANDSNQSTSPKNNKETQKEDMIPESTQDALILDKKQPPTNVVILNDFLENPQTQFIQLDTRGHVVETQLKSVDENTLMCATMSSKPIEENQTEFSNNSEDLLYFEDMHADFAHRIELLNQAVNLHRNAVNYISFDSPDEDIKLCSENDFKHNVNANLDTLEISMKRKSSTNYEDFEKTPQKRCMLNQSEGNALKTSPTPSDTSVSSKENDELHKNSDLTKKLDRHKTNVEKLSRQQRYSSDDLYKPRPILGQRSRRRGMDSII